MKQIAKEVNDSIGEIIRTRLNALRTGEASDDDMLSLLLESSSQETDKEFGMTTKEIVEECKLFYFAGQETTAVLLVWTMILLSMYPDWQEHAREEVLQHFGTNIPDFDGLNRLRIVSRLCTQCHDKLYLAKKELLIQNVLELLINRGFSCSSKSNQSL